MSDYYIRNRVCGCQRCRCRGLVGAAVLITLGVLFLLDNFNVVGFDSSWPALLIVIGLVLYLGRAASTEGHVQPIWAAGAVNPPPTAPPQSNDPQVKP